MDFQTGHQLLHYRLIEKIGKGGMGVVWKATETYSRRIASMIRDCRMAIFSGAAGEFITDLSIARTFLGGAEEGSQ